MRSAIVSSRGIADIVTEEAVTFLARGYPNVQNAEVKQLLVNTGPTLAGHLIHAKQVQTRLAGR
jgi:hypothetical protein